MTTPQVPLPGYYQVAYVTNDFDRALDQFSLSHGIRTFMEMRDMRYPTGEGRVAVCNIALAYSGSTEIEVINPLDGDVQLYRDFLPDAQFTVRFHHISKLHDSEASLEAELAKVHGEGRETPINARDSQSGSRYFYGDYRRELGHFLENIYFPPSAEAWLRSIPRN